MSAAAKHTLKHNVSRTLKGADDVEREEVLLAAGTEITMRRIKGKDLRVTDDHGGDVGKTWALLAKITGQSIDVIDNMDAEDLAALAERLDDFLPASLRTGPTSSGT